MTRLERGYRRLVACYPRSFRKENQEEIIAVLLATALVTWGSIRAHAVAHYPHYAAQVSRLVNDDVTADMVILPILILAWLWVAWGNGRGSQLARVAAIVFTVLLGIDLSEGVALLAPAALIVSGVSWAFGVGAVAFLLAPQSWPYYERPPARREDALV
jgi:hypothetical protein